MASNRGGRDAVFVLILGLSMNPTVLTQQMSPVMMVSKFNMAALAVSATLCASTAVAEAHDTPAVASVIEQLQEYGYDYFEVEKTLLGRVTISAERGEDIRQVVMTKSGKVLRDELFESGEVLGRDFGAQVAKEAQNVADQGQTDGRSFGSSVAENASNGRSGGEASEGRSGGGASEGRSGGAASEGSSGSGASEGRSGGAASEGSSGGGASEGRSGGAASDGSSGGEASEGRSGGAASEGGLGRAESAGGMGRSASEGGLGRASGNAGAGNRP